MYELKIRWTNGWITTIIRQSYDACLKAAARDAMRRGMTYVII